MQQRQRQTQAFPLVLLLIMSVGCGGQSGPERASLKGTVSLDGEPMGGGVVTFQSPKGAWGTTIQKGEFAMSGDEGLPVGDYTIRFNWLKPTGKKIIEPDSGQETDETLEAIPVKYNLQTTEKATIKSGNNTVKFDLLTK